MDDKTRLDWFEEKVNIGWCPAIINDDAGRWAVACDGMQNVPDSDKATDIQTTFSLKLKNGNQV